MCTQGEHAQPFQVQGVLSSSVSKPQGEVWHWWSGFLGTVHKHKTVLWHSLFSFFSFLFSHFCITKLVWFSTWGCKFKKTAAWFHCQYTQHLCSYLWHENYLKTNLISINLFKLFFPSHLCLSPFLFFLFSPPLFPSKSPFPSAVSELVVLGGHCVPTECSCPLHVYVSSIGCTGWVVGMLRNSSEKSARLNYFLTWGINHIANFISFVCVCLNLFVGVFVFWWH